MCSALQSFLQKHTSGKILVGLTAWDYPSGLLAERSGGIDIVLVADSLGKVILGLQGSISLTLDEMIHHTKAVARAVKTPLLIADLPMGCYEVTPEQALQSAIRMIKECPGVTGVKIEGTQDLCPAVRKITSAGIPVFVQVGLTPQRSIQVESNQTGVGRTAASAGEIIDAAIALEKAGAVGLFLTALSEQAAKYVSEHVNIPTIGIGSGSACSGQIVLQSEMLGYQDPWVPQWHSQYESIGAKSLTAIRNYVKEVGDCVFPGEELVQLSFLPPDRQY
ncbi:uncharacterized protein H6S33_003453 [Morchella sextelata]|uniref:uncharacterized protein n=1 Tax=Morchella sextelata TaxID=1174677 RepID=UPI001D050F87|nr:uncharacterized protein H6S33_003453 [Morchella sextelata]KAH0606619.1 hypothetical protein H6S33_003453 [Morchella sextelata]